MRVLGIAVGHVGQVIGLVESLPEANDSRMAIATSDRNHLYQAQSVRDGLVAGAQLVLKPVVIRCDFQFWCNGPAYGTIRRIGGDLWKNLKNRPSVDRYLASVATRLTWNRLRQKG